MDMYLRQGFISAPFSIYRNLRKLIPGTVLKVGRVSNNIEDYRPRPYWSMADIVQSAVDRPFSGSREEAACELETLLENAVCEQMVADVPVGAFLSGGIDSSTVVAIMQSKSQRPVKTFTIGFRDPSLDEAPYAREVARHLGTEHSELYVDDKEILETLPRIAAAYDEPFADASAIPTFLIAELARQAVTVSLSGDGGDELFCGYGRYQEMERQWRAIERVPLPLRRFAQAGRYLLSYEWRRRLGGALPARDRREFYRSRTSQWGDPAAVQAQSGHCARRSPAYEAPISGLKGSAVFRYLDSMNYLPDDILTKLDRATMASGLEARVPLLDNRIIEFAWRLPPEFLVCGGVGKQVLRDVLSRHVPDRMVDRPKAGFGVPMDSWLRGPLRDWAEDILDPRNLGDSGLFQTRPILSMWQRLKKGGRGFGDILWVVLIFEDWRRRNL